ncbi:MAG: ABC transporter substrate-binding protein [Rhodospirillaceae bacterium]|nr:ABC transporter substrate-binding protein [Rhodospirillaceae bacterium]
MRYQLRRRGFIAQLGGTAAAWPLAARAQQPAIPMIAFLHGNKPQGDAGAVAGIKEGLKEAGFIDGKNVAFEYRWAENHFDRLPALAAELIARRPAVIIVGGGSAAAVAAKAGTSTIPIVLAFGSDPVELGLAPRLDRPGGNVTGVIFPGQHAPERVKLLSEMAPQAKTIAYLRTGPQFSNAVTEEQTAKVAAAAQALGRQLVVFKVDNRRDIDAAFATLVDQKVGALDIAAHPFFDDDETITHLATLTLRHKVPGIFIQQAFPAAGGLMSYGESYAEGFRHAGMVVAKILKGEKAGDLSFDQSVKVELIINGKTAKAFGLTIPPSLLSRAHQVIE